MKKEKPIKSPFQVKNDTRVITKKLTHDELVEKLSATFFDVMQVEFDMEGKVHDVKRALYVYGSACMATLVQCGFDYKTAYGVSQGINNTVREAIEEMNI